MSDIRIKGLNKTFGTYQALRNLNLDLADGHLLALLGPSGCGKSTTLQMLAGFEAPSSGEIWAGDRLISSPTSVVPPEKRGISLVFQNYAVWPHMTVAENIAFGLKIRRLSRSEVAEGTRAALDAVRLGQLADRYPSELSGGQQQRVALARALAVRPGILLLDEPLSNLDAALRDEMRFEIRRVHDELGITTVYVTHDQSEALVTADRIAVMKLGELQQLGAPEEVFDRPANEFVASFIGNNNTVPGISAGKGALRFGGETVTALDRSGAGEGGGAVLIIRPGKIRLYEEGTAPAGLANALPATVLRSAYLGESRDILAELATGATMRVLVPPEQRPAPGDRVVLELPAAHCQILPGG
ncbi:ABC transporter ATP-binding protein [Pseudogemmobacter humi]|uniref:sn-glycerol-3-phosphate import ATP-binding protein UgpC n=1 Tax=Pseudogemmobacter humi TaxID=2483812 RepID=A0A3P5WXU7_9RHOB|nr:ABC transporter ATP-binding protein [Pseudogemmobacter humi]VDC28027.1 sn-glycerol-3-phosphate import ATP-binding protein UgpC [Pseudogemmobacter humi]